MSPPPPATPPIIAAAVAKPVPQRAAPTKPEGVAATSAPAPRTQVMSAVRPVPQDQQNNLPPHMRGRVAGMPKVAQPALLEGRQSNPLFDGPAKEVNEARLMAAGLRNVLQGLLQGAATTIQEVDRLLEKAKDNEVFVKALELEGMPPEALGKLRKECLGLIDAQKPPVSAA